MLAVRVDLLSALHHGSGMAKGEFVDRAVLRRDDGLPYIAGSAIKGKLRHAAEQIIADRMGRRPHDGMTAGFCKRAPRCLVCRVFGNPMAMGKAIFTDAVPIDPSLFGIDEESEDKAAAAGLEERTTTAVNRRRRVVQAKHLFTSEVVSRCIAFRFTVEGRLDVEELELVRQSLLLVTHLGGGGSRGLGAVELTEEQGELQN